MKKVIFGRLLAVVFINLFLFSNVFSQQGLPEVRVSPKASVMQMVGLAKVEINYSRPAVKGREIWGKLVPFGFSPAEGPYGSGEPMPWRAGADENTTIQLSHDAKINGQIINAGIYGIHMIPGKDEWTVIFSKDYKAWGSYFYKTANDVIRVKVKPQESPLEEWLLYGFDNLTSSSCNLFMAWEKIKVGVKIEFDEYKIVFDAYKDALIGEAGFDQASWSAAANYGLSKNYNLEESLAWINNAIKLNGNNFVNNSIKARLLIALGKTEEGNKLLNASLETASETELNTYGRQLMNSNKTDDAVKIFELNIKKNPKSWMSYFNLGRAFASKGDKKTAKENYEKALGLAPEAQKARIEGLIKGL